MVQNDKYNRKLRESTKRLIANDGLTIKSLLLNIKEQKGIVSLFILLQVILYCRETQEFFGKKFLDENTEKKFYDLRNKLKIFGNKYNHSQKEFLKSDYQQDESFKNDLRFDFMKSWNIHYNLGIYFDKEGHILSNTQFMQHYLEKADLLDADSEEQKRIEMISFGQRIGECIERILLYSGVHKNGRTPYLALDNLQVGYVDINTNIEKEFFTHPENKGLNLVFLHMLSLLGTDKYFLRKILNVNNTWRLRNEYITAHNIQHGLIIIMNHFKMSSVADSIDLDRLKEVIEKGDGLFSTNYRNCMMHYNLIQKEDPCIKQELFCMDEPFYGLIESCFNGKNQEDYYSELRAYMDVVECYLSEWFFIDRKRIKFD